MSLRTASLFMALVALMGNTISAEEVVVADVDTVYDTSVDAVSFNTAVNAELASLRTELAELRANVGGGVGKGCNDCGAMGCNCFCNVGCGGWRAGVDLLIVKPHFDNGVDHFGGGQTLIGGQVDETDNPAQAEPDWDFNVSPRFWLGYENACGRGIRFRYWILDQDSNAIVQTDADSPPFEATLVGNIDLQSMDLEVYQRACLGPVNLNFVGGVRWAKVDVTRLRYGQEEIGGGPEIGPFFTASNTDFEGFGPTMALEVSAPINECTSIIGNVRGSLLYGDTKMGLINQETIGGGPNFGMTETQLLQMSEDDDVAYVLEAQLGVERTRCFWNGILRLSAVLEAQYWGGAGFDGLLFPGGFPEEGGPPFSNERNTADSSIGFIGATIGVVYEQ